MPSLRITKGLLHNRIFKLGSYITLRNLRKKIILPKEVLGAINSIEPLVFKIFKCELKVIWTLILLGK